MVWLFTRIEDDQCIVYVLPHRVFEDLIEVHVLRTHLHKKGETTCLVMNGRDWTEIPSEKNVLMLLGTLIVYNKAREGERRYPLPHKFFNKIKCRGFSPENIPSTKEKYGDMVIRCTKHKGGQKVILKKLPLFEKDKSKVEKIYTRERKAGKTFKEYFYYIEHLHPSL